MRGESDDRFVTGVSVEQIKGSNEVRQRIITAAREARKSKDYPNELQADCSYITDKYSDHHTNKILPPTHAPYPSLERELCQVCCEKV